MALSILDGNQSATTLSTILSSGQHITAHTVVSLGTQAITDMRSAVSGSVVSIPSLPAISGTVTANVPQTTVTKGIGQDTASITGIPVIPKFITNNGGVGVITDLPIQFVGGTDDTFLKNVLFKTDIDGENAVIVGDANPLPISGTVTIGSALPAGTNRIGVVTIGAGTVTIGAGTAQIGSVTASISGTVPISISSVTIGNSITIGSCVTHGVTIANSSVTVNGTFFQNTQPVSLSTLPALVTGTAQIGSVTVGNTVTIAGTVTANPTGTQTIAGSVTLGASTSQIGAVTASISNSVTIGSLPAISGTVTANLAISSSAITSGSFTSLTSATLVPANTARKMATVYNLGAGQLFVNAGTTATTLGGGFMVALSSGDYFECGFTTTTLSAIYATAGTASWVSH